MSGRSPQELLGSAGCCPVRRTPCRSVGTCTGQAATSSRPDRRRRRKRSPRRYSLCLT